MKRLTLAIGLLLASEVQAQEPPPPPPPPCAGAAALVCGVVVIPLSIAIIDATIDAACPGTAYPPGMWPADAGPIPVYDEQWLRTGCMRPE